MPNNHLIIGLGEVGRAINEVFSANSEVDTLDIASKYPFQLGYQGNLNQHDGHNIMHICFPYSDQFVKQVKEYQRQYRPKYTVIHSTVPVGTSRKCKAIHAPIRGLHPFLAKSLFLFPMFLGGSKASEIADSFRKVGLKVILVDKPETTEAGKLFDTEYYRACIEFMQRVMKYCEDNKLNFHEVYTLFNQTYNEGYAKLGYPEYVRPVLQPIKGRIGGHCVLPNSKLI